MFDELVRNTLDASASCVAVRVNLPQLEVQVVDNGTGMTPELMARVGDRYVTTHGDTPCRSSVKPFGYRGESLASIARVCRRLEITSRRRGSEQTWRRRLVTSSRSRRGGPVSSGGEGRSSPGDSGRGEAAGRQGTGAAPSPVSQQRPSAGTTVTVRGLLAGRRACRRQAELESVCRVLETLALPRPDVSFSLRDDATGRLLMDAARRSSVLERYSDVIEPLTERQARPLAARRGKVRVSGFTTAPGGPQFVFVNGRPPVLTAVERAVMAGVADGAARLQGDGAETGNEPVGTAAAAAVPACNYLLDRAEARRGKKVARPGRLEPPLDVSVPESETVPGGSVLDKVSDMEPTEHHSGDRENGRPDRADTDKESGAGGDCGGRKHLEKTRTSDGPESPPVLTAGEVRPAPSPARRPADQSDSEEILPGQVLGSIGADASHLPWADEMHLSDIDRQDDGAHDPSAVTARQAASPARPQATDSAGRSVFVHSAAGHTGLEPPAATGAAEGGGAARRSAFSGAAGDGGGDGAARAPAVSGAAEVGGGAARPRRPLVFMLNDAPPWYPWAAGAQRPLVLTHGFSPFLPRGRLRLPPPPPPPPPAPAAEAAADPRDERQPPPNDQAARTLDALTSGEFERPVVSLRTGLSAAWRPQACDVTKETLQTVRVLKQLDNKFIAACSGDVVLLFDQHAVSERINLENILEDAGATGGSERLRSTDLSPPLPLRLARRQARLLAAHPAAVQRLGFVLDQLTELNDSEVAAPSCHEAALLSLRAAPACLCERAEREWTAQRAAAVLTQLADQLTESRGAAAALPAALADVYHSLACH
ncbi:uncharacterized protein LOC122392302 [Amphibalanus amphitrite]|uniref:uncharacterized protein LOC122392302 n=1 Tax=Amphibalanus amphitrite TaxID=1232801 RepID=UPI001C911E03|nr:uncharacterized protein LOC122392302 [Amphibalanus amphitrite]